MSEAEPDSGLPDYPEQFAGIRRQVEQRLSEVAPTLAGAAPRLKKSIRYSLLDGGKRLRPLITVLAAEVLGGRGREAIDPACAIEMVHTASLMIDDLPCMDNASQRVERSAIVNKASPTPTASPMTADRSMSVPSMGARTSRRADVSCVCLISAICSLVNPRFSSCCRD